MTRNISVIGLGKLGAPMVAIFASTGYRVIGVDVDSHKVDQVRARIAPVDETGLGLLLRGDMNDDTRSKYNLETTLDIVYAVRESDVTFIVVATPSEPDGGFSLGYVYPVLEKIGHALEKKKGFHVVVLTSTVMPGSTDGPVRDLLEKVSGKKAGVDFGLCYNPEFIALGTVIRDFKNPDFVLIGESDTRSGDILAQIYSHVCDNDPMIARMSAINAELTKLAVNTFITTKITYANMLSRICEGLPGANVDVVTRAIGLDTRIGRKCLIGGSSYGGPCFPRDNRALARVAINAGTTADLAEVVDSSNREEIVRLADLVQSFGKKTKVGILGLAYKLGTKINEESAGAKLRAELICRGTHTVYIEGPSSTVEECVKFCDVIVVMLPDGRFRLPAQNFRGKVVIDCWREMSYVSGEAHYVPLGVGR